jgi:hypothetical protein
MKMGKKYLIEEVEETSPWKTIGGILFILLIIGIFAAAR